MRHLVIVGGGFGGVRLARRLRKEKNIYTTIVNNGDEFRYCPALYRSATGRKMGVSRLPLEWMLLDIPNVSLRQDTASTVDLKAKRLGLESGEVIEYDDIVFSMGVMSTFFNIRGFHEFAYGMKTPEEVIKLRNHLHDTLLLDDEASRNFVIVGGGPTGVELAAGMGDYLKKIAKKHHRSRRKINIWLVEGAPRLIPVMSERAGRLASKRLKMLGVKIHLNTKVTAGKLKELRTSEGPIPTHAIIWTAGAINNPFFADKADIFPIGERNKISVNKHLQVHSNTYVIGDNAATKFSGLAYTAIKDADFVAKDIKARLKGSERPEYKPHTPIQIIPVGDRYAILQRGSITLGGIIPAILRRLADFIGYADVMGPLRAMTIWRASDTIEESCSTCARRK
ncbi:MAG: FAD-dependent oxidoreductase [bacterium]|nr:FAD-dependent oxidoreductase [bacterium]